MVDLSKRSARRRGVIVNYAAAITVMTVFCIGEYQGWSPSLGILSLVALVVCVLSLMSTYGRTGIWKLAHADASELDERQIQVTHASFRQSYRVFAAVAMLLLWVIVLSVRFSVFTLTFRGHYSFGLAIAILLNYLVNVLPSSFLAWHEKSTPAASI